jgi:hypothetical membrane protein
MTEHSTTKSPAVLSVAAARLSIAAAIAYQLILLALIFLRPDLDPSWHTVSEWAIGPYGWLMQTAFVVSAVSYGALFVVVRRHVRGVLGRIGLAILLLCAIGAAGVGLFVTDPMPLRPPLSTTGTFHVVFGTIQLMLLPFAALPVTVALMRRSAAWADARPVLRWTAGLPLLAFIGFVVHLALFVIPLGPSAYGPGVQIGWPPRVLFLIYGIWVISVAHQALTVHARGFARGGLDAQDPIS